MGFIWTIIIGFVAGVIAKFIMPGSNEPSGFVLTTILGIVGAFVASSLGKRLDGMRPARARDSSAPSSAPSSFSLSGDSSQSGAHRRLKASGISVGRVSYTSRSESASTIIREWLRELDNERASLG